MSWRIFLRLQDKPNTTVPRVKVRTSRITLRIPRLKRFSPTLGHLVLGKIDTLEISYEWYSKVSILYSVQQLAGGSSFNLDGFSRFNDVRCFDVLEGLWVQCVGDNVDTAYLSELVGRDTLSLWGIPRLDRLRELKPLDRSVMKPGASAY